jgi:hypothetical protein
MIVRIMSDMARFVANMLIVTTVIGFLVAGGVVIKLWRNRP